MSVNYISPISGGYPSPSQDVKMWTSLNDVYEDKLQGIIHKVTLLRLLKEDKLTKYSRFNKKVYLLTDELPLFFLRLEHLLQNSGRV